MALTKAQILERETRIWELSARGWSLRKIAVEVGMSHENVRLILEKVHARTLATLSANVVDHLKVQTDDILGHVIEENSEAWHKSKEPLRRARITTNAEGEEVTVVDQTDREGNVAYLDRVMAALDRRMKLWGLGVADALQETIHSAAAIAAGIKERGDEYDARLTQEGQPGDAGVHPPGDGSGAAEVQDGPGPVQ